MTLICSDIIKKMKDSGVKNKDIARLLETNRFVLWLKLKGIIKFSIADGIILSKHINMFTREK